jgi:hypothetical protein
MPLTTAKSDEPARRLGFAQLFGLHPAVALLFFCTDGMIFGADWLSSMTLWPFTLAAGCVLGYITYLAQQKWYGDDKENAKIKALILAFLTTIPLPLPAILSVPAGLVGLFRRKSV